MMISMRPPKNERKYQRMKRKWYKHQMKTPRNEHYGWSDPNKPDKGFMFRLLGRLWNIIKTIILVIIFLFIMNILLNFFFPDIMADIPGAFKELQTYFETHKFYITFK